MNSKKRILNKAKEQGCNIFKREINIDTRLIESFLASNHNTSTRDLTFEEIKKINEINYIINNMLPDIEKQVVYLLYFFKKQQETVGALLGISQEMVFYYKERALLRIKIHNFFRTVDIQNMEEFLVKYVTRKQRIAMIEYFKEHDLRKIAKKISIAEGRKRSLHYKSICSRVNLGLKRLSELKDVVEDKEIKQLALLYYKVFKILKRYNSLYHTQSKKIVHEEIIA